MKNKKTSKNILLMLFSVSVFVCVSYIYTYVPLRTALFRSFAKGTVYMCSEEDTLYVYGYAGVQKYLVSNPNHPILLAANDDFCKNSFIGHLIARSGVVKDDYLYVACRSYLGGKDTCDDGDYFEGKMLILRKRDLKVVKEYKSDIKLIEAKIKDSLLVVSGLYGFDIYDIKKKLEIKRVFKYRQRKFTEFQGVDFIEKDTSLLLAFSRFGEGVSLWDITKPQKAHSIYNFKFSDTLSNGKNIGRGVQSFKLIYNTPYLYATIAPIKETFGKENDVRGVLTFNLSDMGNIKTVFSTIPHEVYYSTLIGDPEPSFISVYEDKLYTNFGEKGVAVFELKEPNKPKFKEVVDINNNGNMILPIHINNRGVIFTGDYYWNDIYSYRIK